MQGGKPRYGAGENEEAALSQVEQLPQWARTNAAKVPSAAKAEDQMAMSQALTQLSHRNEAHAADAALVGQEPVAVAKGEDVEEHKTASLQPLLTPSKLPQEAPGASDPPAVRLYLDKDAQEDEPLPAPPSSRPIPSTRPSLGSKSRAQAMVEAASFMSAFPAMVTAQRERSPSPPVQVADAKAIAARERFMKNREVARNNTRSLEAPVRTSMSKLPMRKEDMGRLIEGRIASKMEAERRAQQLAMRAHSPIHSTSSSTPQALATKKDAAPPGSSGGAVGGRPLPIRAKRMAAQFDCLDTALSFAKARSVGPTLFAALRASVQELTMRDFDLADLRRILTIAPWAYR